MKARVRRSRRYRGILLKPLPPLDHPDHDDALRLRLAAILNHYGTKSARELLMLLLVAHVPGFRTRQSPPPGRLDPIEDMVQRIFAPSPGQVGRRPVFVGIALSLAEERRDELRARNHRLSEVEICRRILRHDSYFRQYGRGSPETLARLLRERRRRLGRRNTATKSLP